MNLRLTGSAALALLFSFAALASAQSGPPPMKMGLWQQDVNVDMSGMPGAAGGSHAVSTQSCMTEDTWKQSFQNMQNRRGPMPQNCSNDNLQQDGHHFTFDTSCTMQQGMSMKVHVDMTLDSDTSMHGEAVSTVSGGNLPQEMTVHTTIHSKFISSDCGSVKPGSSKLAN